MRFIHTSDWHLGRLLEQHHLTDDQAQVLDQLFLLAKDSESAAFLISGDIYDRGVPPPEAVELLSDFVSRLALDLGITVIMITHEADIAEYAKRVIAIKDGSIISDKKNGNKFAHRR